MKKVYFMTVFACLVLMIPRGGGAVSTDVPHFLNYQSLLYDDGGNLIPDGESNLKFRIIDVSGGVLFEEQQKVNVVNGYVSALVGNGLDVNGAPSGGVPVNIFTPGAQLFLEVSADNYPPEPMLEIVSVPYSIYAEKAMTVADGSIGEAALKQNIITREHLKDDLIAQLADEMDTANLVATTADLTNLQTSYSAPTGSANIGTAGGLNYSTGGNVEVVIHDLDTAIANRQAELTAHANTNIAVAHPNGTIPISRLDTNVATQDELEAHTHTGGSDGAKLNGLAFWSTSGGASDDSYVSIASGFNVNSCSIVVAPHNVNAYVTSPSNLKLCAKFCRDSSGNGFRVRCRTADSPSTPTTDGCVAIFGDSLVEGGNCDSTAGRACSVSYMAFCPR
jgi:hypothetical protein